MIRARTLPLPAAAALLCGALLFSLSPGAATSQSSEELSLEELVARSSVILIAAPAKPPSRRESVDITPPGEQPSQERFPAYERTVTRWMVQEVLAGHQPAAPKPGATVEVTESDAHMRLDVHRRYYVEHVNKWPIYQRYSAGFKLEGDGPRILFLVGYDRGLELVAEASWESVKRKAEVLALHKEQPSPFGIVEVKSEAPKK